MLNFKFISIVFFSIASALFSQEIESLKIGIAPHSSARIIYDVHRDLKTFLEHYFNRPVQILSAKTFSDFADTCDQGDTYDLIITSPNLAYLAQHQAHYVPLMTYTKGLETIILSKTSSLLKDHPKTVKIAGQDPVSYATLCGEEWLEQQGYVPGRNLIYSYYISASDSLATLLLKNQVDLIIISLPNYLRLDQELQNQLFVVYHSSPKPGRIFLAKASKGITIEEWRNALVAFSQSQEGARHLKATKLEGFEMLEPHALDTLRAIAQKTSSRLTH
ncbi:PhnD/SsuA/transferrin family substrate-binding protein [Sulfurospirillum sp. MES]|uniref:PhnD/SsuA/transferrin family substrate-binding protein n=1 Tax=Sulfurospirillum sp. MES TaxID=1565314 RepID=UPI000542EF53|nr:PhnD/SsuA/transferrin family substrate-binding protein [Sulfurospirillum sp. MES]KHG33613.1 MAG: hypothetical protein OA34_08645 [Sulfurospirillum sp. MES]